VLLATVAKDASPVIANELPSLFPVHVGTLCPLGCPRHIYLPLVMDPAGSAMARFAAVWGQLGWTYPIKCGNGHAWGPGKVIVSYA
jgi:hypothetical protein